MVSSRSPTNSSDLLWKEINSTCEAISAGESSHWLSSWSIYLDPSSSLKRDLSSYLVSY
jgi:hypothetical protein